MCAAPLCALLPLQAKALIAEATTESPEPPFDTTEFGEAWAEVCHSPSFPLPSPPSGSQAAVAIVRCSGLDLMGRAH